MAVWLMPLRNPILNKTGIEIYFMEYDTNRAGGLEPLKLLPKGKKCIMLGFATTNTPQLVSKDWVHSQFETGCRGSLGRGFMPRSHSQFVAAGVSARNGDFHTPSECV